MVRIYVNLIRKGLRTIDDVPTLYREAVAAELAKAEQEV